jgi:hypothetical protein
MVGIFTKFVELRKMYDENMGHKQFILYSATTIFKDTLEQGNTTSLSTHIII